jgi:hypothetical protein
MKEMKMKIHEYLKSKINVYDNSWYKVLQPFKLEIGSSSINPLGLIELQKDEIIVHHLTAPNGNVWFYYGDFDEKEDFFGLILLIIEVRLNQKI